LPRDFCRLLGLGCPKQAFAKIVARLVRSALPFWTAFPKKGTNSHQSIKNLINTLSDFEFKLL